MNRCLEVLLKHGVRTDLVDRVRLSFENSSTTTCTSPVSYNAMSLTEGIGTEFGSTLNTLRVESGVKRHRENFYFMQKHVAVLAEILAPYSYKWHELGIALSLSYNCLQSLQTTIHFH